MTSHLGDLLVTARETIGYACDLLAQTPLDAVQSKQDRDLVSNVDLSIERAIRARLADRTPTIGFLGEEEGTSDGSPHAETWILDPVDGTNNFIHGIPLYGISLALVRENRPEVGVIALPGQGSVYYGATGLGAFKDDRPIRCRSTPNLSEAIVTMGDYAVGDNAPDKNTRRLSLTAHLAGTVERVRMLGSAAVDMAWLAEGRTDAALALSNSAWDFTAGVAIAREAGARVRDIDGTEHSLTSRGLIATAAGVSDEAVALVRKAMDDTNPAPNRTRAHLS
ncbi:inositol monophosphatase [Nocardioidaceae bacterium SCSIO 66511]|nr:inositol monophosphatase [Nocardioidaceae bacterium SCSIO 66511]